jgi:hypothetical protein
MKIQNLTIELRPDGLHCEHENGARVVISLDRLARWVLSQLRGQIK